MKYYHIVFIRILCFLVYACITISTHGQNDNVITDGFNDGNFTKNPEWFTDPNDWFINDEFKLQSAQKSVAGESSIVTNLPEADAYDWTFNVTIKTKPSTNNNSKIYLVASKKDLLTKPSGYYVDISSSSIITLRERKTDGGKTSAIVSMKIDLSKGIDKTFNVSYNENKKWVLRVKNGDVYDSVESDEAYEDFIKGSYFGFYIQYSKTNTYKFLFSDVKIKYSEKDDSTPEPPSPEPPPINPDDEVPIYKYNDIIVNEILFNPKTKGFPFIEIYNNSNKDVNLKYLKIATLKDDGDIKSQKDISKTDLILSPSSYLVLTKSKQNLLDTYYCPDPNNIFELNLPTITVSSGTLAVIQNDTIVDSVYYNENMHYPMLNTFKGISLERINFKAPSQTPSSFHSASADVGFATPGYKNSQFIENDNLLNNNFKLSSKVISPGVSGKNNILEISYEMDDHDYLASIKIFDINGNLINEISNNQLLGRSGSFFWNGLNNNNQQVKQGLYIIKIKAHNSQGKIKKFQDAFGVTY